MAEAAGGGEGAEGEEELPYGWFKKWSVTKLRYYYFDKLGGVSQWAKPKQDVCQTRSPSRTRVDKTDRAASLSESKVKPNAYTARKPVKTPVAKRLSPSYTTTANKKHTATSKRPLSQADKDAIQASAGRWSDGYVDPGTAKSEQEPSSAADDGTKQLKIKRRKTTGAELLHKFKSSTLARQKALEAAVPVCDTVEVIAEKAKSVKAPAKVHAMAGKTAVVTADISSVTHYQSVPKLNLKRLRATVEKFQGATNKSAIAPDTEKHKSDCGVKKKCDSGPKKPNIDEQVKEFMSSLLDDDVASKSTATPSVETKKHGKLWLPEQTLEAELPQGHSLPKKPKSNANSNNNDKILPTSSTSKLLPSTSAAKPRTKINTSVKKGTERLPHESSVGASERLHETGSVDSVNLGSCQDTWKERALSRSTLAGVSSLPCLLKTNTSMSILADGSFNREESRISEANVEEDMEIDNEMTIVAIHDIRRDFHHRHSNEPLGELTDCFLRTPTGQPSTLPERRHEGSDLAIQVAYVVIDTNVLINDLSFLSQLKDDCTTGWGTPILVIPWVVMQELDALKNNKRNTVSESTLKRVRNAVDFLNTYISSGHPRIIGQTPKEANAGHRDLANIENNDDRILQCCLNWKDKYNTQEVVLLTGDKHLRTKAAVLQLTALSKDDLSGKIQESSTHPAPVSRPGSSSECSAHDYQRLASEAMVQDPLSPVLRQDVCTPAALRVVDSQVEHKHYSLRVVKEAEETLATAFSSVLETKMKDIYGELWEAVVFIKPPWVFTDILQCLKKHWIAVFGDVVGRQNERFVASCLPPGKKNMSFQSALTFLNECDVLCQIFAQFARVARANDRIQRLSDICRAVLSGQCPVEALEDLPGLLSQVQEDVAISSPVVTSSSDIPSPKEPSCCDIVQNAFQIVWEGILHFITSVREPLSAAPGTGQPREVVVDGLATFCALIAAIHSAYRRILPLSTLPGGPSDSLAYGDLCTALNDFVSAANIQNWRTVAAHHMEFFCRDASNRLTLENGLSQLEHMMNDLTQIQSLLSPAEVTVIQGRIQETAARVHSE